jgi:hypothetical protein
MTELERVCEDLRRDSNALAVLIMDADWQELARAGAGTLVDANTLTLLRSNAARLMVEREVIGRFDNADQRQFHLSLVAGRAIIVVFDARTSLGLVRLRAKKASELLARLIG